MLQCTTSPVYAAGGGITITGGGHTITLSADASNQYAPFSSTTELLPPGQSVSLSTTGGDAPAYTASLTMPARLTVTSPAKPATQLTIDRTHDLAFAWSGAASDTVEIGVSSGSTPGPFVELICEFPATAGSGTIPANVLSSLVAGSGAIGVSALATTEQQSGDWGLYFSLIEDGVWPDGSLASATATVQ